MLRFTISQTGVAIDLRLGGAEDRKYLFRARALLKPHPLEVCHLFHSFGFAFGVSLPIFVLYSTVFHCVSPLVHFVRLCV